MNNVMTNGFCELNEQEMMETEGGLIGEIVIGATLGFSTGMISTCIYNHYTNQETSLSDVLVGGVKGAVKGAVDAAGGIISVVKRCFN